MTFAKLMGITLPVAETGSSGSVEPIYAGEFGRVFSNTPFAAVRSTSQDYQGSTPLLPRAKSTAYRLLVGSQGHGWRFNKAGSYALDTAQVWSTKGLSPVGVSYDNAVLSFASGGPVAGSGFLELSFAAQVVWVMPPSPLLQFTFVTWIRNAFYSDDWVHYVIEAGPSYGRMWENGVEVFDGADFIVAQSQDTWCGYPISGPYKGKLVLGAAVESEEATSLAEMQVLPYCASLLEPDWALWSYNAGAGRRAEPACRVLSMEGDWCERGTDSVEGQVGGQQLVTTASGLHETFGFTLRSTTV